MYHFIVNPVSRSGKGLRLWQNKIEPEIKRQNIEYSVEFSHGHGDVTPIVERITRNAAEEKNCVVVVMGGDGTINDAINGIADFDNTTLGYIPTGSSNDFARDMKISKNPRKCLENIISGKEPDLIDIGILKTDRRERKFAVSCGIGFDAAVCQKAVHSIVKKNLNKIGLGKLTYLAIAVKEVINAPEADATVVFDGGTPVELKKMLFLTCMVHKYEGGGFKFCPDASCRDRTMNFCYSNGKSVIGILTALPLALFGLHKNIRGISTGKFCDSARIKTTVPLWLHTDGEVWQKTDCLEVRTFGKKLKFLM